MKFLAALFLILGPLGLGAAPAGFETASQQFDRQQYREAKASYEQLLQAGPATANLYYNLGNADFRLGEMGAAALQYERALRLDPAHHEARTNLALVRSRAGSHLIPESWLDRLAPAWPAASFAVAAACGGWLAIFGLIWSWRRRESLLAWSLLVGLALAAGGGALLWREEGRAEMAIVLPGSASARTAPADRATVVGDLPAGSEVRILSERGDWIYCELPDRQRGWLAAPAVARLVPPSTV